MKIFFAGEFGGGKERENIAVKLRLKRLYSYFYRDAGLEVALSIKKQERNNHAGRRASFKIQTK